MLQSQSQSLLASLLIKYIYQNSFIEYAQSTSTSPAIEAAQQQQQQQ